MYIFMHRRDLRTRDLAAFRWLRDRQAAARDAGNPADAASLHIFVLDPQLFKRDRQREHSGRAFLAQLERLRRDYEAAGKRLHILYGAPGDVLAALLDACAASPALSPDARSLPSGAPSLPSVALSAVRGVLFHRDYTPYARVRDRALQQIADSRNVPVHAFDDHMLAPTHAFDTFCERTEPYRVFTPYYRRWCEFLDRFPPVPDTEATLASLDTIGTISTIDTINALPDLLLARFAIPDALSPERRLRAFLHETLPAYGAARDAFADAAGTSGLSPYLNSGALSPRIAWAEASRLPHHEPWTRQLAWRDFYYYQAMRNPDFFTYEKRFDFSELSDKHFRAWAEGRTGIPIIDAAMRQLNETGAMPNRLRMVTAMFLTKNLLCPFTLGETYFRYKLADYDNTLNRGGWLWSASLGYDAAPYFRIMNPVSQSQRHDPTGAYIRRWLPERARLSDRDVHLPAPDAIVDLTQSRAAAIDVYKRMLGSAAP